MEVKPSVVESTVFQLLKKFCKFVPNSLLASFFVNQIDEILFGVLLVSFLNMKFGSLETLIKILTNNDWWGPSHGRFHGPD